ncbi:MAG: hypothetical protein NT070_00830 [Cyanobacteria bacterium]|nr:hypothetical protein [Cyanobacteriota bacterium]
MVFSVLTSDFKKQLEQQRSRLLKQRDGIVKAAVAQASQTVDENISHINALLGEPPALKTKRAYTRQSKIDAIAGVTKAPKGKAMSSKSIATKAEKKPKSSSAKLNSETASPELESAFSGLTPAQAIVQVLQGASGRIFNVDEVIAGIYGVVKPDIMPKTRQKIGVTLGHCARRGEFTKVQDMPAQYRWDG